MTLRQCHAAFDFVTPAKSSDSILNPRFRR